MKEHIQQTLRHLNFESNIAGVFVNSKDSSFVFVGWARNDDDDSIDDTIIILEFSPGGSLDAHRVIKNRDDSEDAIEDLECDADFTWIDLD